MVFGEWLWASRIRLIDLILCNAEFDSSAQHVQGPLKEEEDIITRNNPSANNSAFNQFAMV